MYVSLSKVDMTIFEPKGRYGTITVEVYIFFKKRWKAVIRLYAKESAIDILGDLQLLSPILCTYITALLTVPVVSSSKISASSRDGLLKPLKNGVSGNLT